MDTIDDVTPLFPLKKVTLEYEDGSIYYIEGKMLTKWNELIFVSEISALIKGHNQYLQGVEFKDGKAISESNT